jgi:hypothetical protein
LALKCQKYDKAIFHLLESLKEAKEISSEPEKTTVLKTFQGKKTIRKSNSSKV